MISKNALPEVMLKTKDPSSRAFASGSREPLSNVSDKVMGRATDSVVK
jgi:hypothetical protein